MNEIKIGDKTICVVEIEESAYGFHVYNGRLCWRFAGPCSVKLPSGNWQILGRASEITELQAEQLVNRYLANMFENYEDSDYFYDTALESWQSFMRANNIKDTDLILLKNS